MRGQLSSSLINLSSNWPTTLMHLRSKKNVRKSMRTLQTSWLIRSFQPTRKWRGREMRPIEWLSRQGLARPHLLLRIGTHFESLLGYVPRVGHAQFVAHLPKCMVPIHIRCLSIWLSSASVVDLAGLHLAWSMFLSTAGLQLFINMSSTGTCVDTNCSHILSINCRSSHQTSISNRISIVLFQKTTRLNLRNTTM